MVGYLFSRWGSGRLGHVADHPHQRLIRGSYHLYQGFGGFVGNLVMGIIFGWFYTRTKRVMPLVVAHTILDVVAFVGYALLKDRTRLALSVPAHVGGGPRVHSSHGSPTLPPERKSLSVSRRSARPSSGRGSAWR